MTATTHAQLPRDAVVEEFDSLLALGFDVNDVLLALGKRYEAVRKSVIRAERRDLADVLETWKRGDADRLKRAKGLVWL